MYIHNRLLVPAKRNNCYESDVHQFIFSAIPYNFMQ